jgi:hypothetical protein
MSHFQKARSALLFLTCVIALSMTGCGGSRQNTGIIPAAPASGSIHNTLTVTTVPMHVQNYTFWHQSGVANNVPASWMASWATWAEIGTSAYANQFHAAGGKHTVVFTDPNYYYVLPTWTSPGNYPESAFGHGSNGVRTQWDGLYGGVEYYLLPNSPTAQAGYVGVVKQVTAGGGYDYVYADGVSDSLTVSLWGQRLPKPVEITTNAQYVTGMEQTLAGSSLPTIINGYNNGNPMVETEYVGSPNIAGIFGEDCFTGNKYIHTDNYWIDQENALLYTTRHGIYAICGGRGAELDNRPERIYYLASWWLSYDPHYSVSLAEFASPGNVYVFPEQTIVPTQADQNPSNISAIRWWTGAYVRWFESCFYQQVWLGRCAAVVNPSSTRSAAIPSLPFVYTHSLTLDGNNLYAGGKVYLSTSVPTTLAPASAAILFQ